MSKKNSCVLWDLLDDDLRCLCLAAAAEDDEDDDDDDDDYDYEDRGKFVVREEDNLGWLGYFVGRSNSLTELSIEHLPREGERIHAFFAGVERNSSIENLIIQCDSIFTTIWSLSFKATITLRSLI